MRSLLLALALCLSCSFQEAPAPPPPPPVTPTPAPPLRLKLARLTAPRALEPQLITEPEDEQLASALFSGLTRCDAETLSPRPGLAGSWEVSGDGRVYTFRLRPDLRFSDGGPLTAEDVAFAWRRLLDPKSRLKMAFLLDEVEGAQAFRRGERLVTTREVALEDGGALKAGEATRALLADVSELGRSAPLLARPGGKSLAELMPGDVVALEERPAAPEGYYEVRVLESGANLGGGALSGFIEAGALSPLYGPVTRGVVGAHLTARSFPDAAAPEAGALSPGQVVGSVPGEVGRRQGDVGWVRVKTPDGEVQGWVDASALSLRAYGAERVLVEAVGAPSRRGWVDAADLSPDAGALGVRVVDKRTLEVRLTRPAAWFPALLCRPQLAPVPTRLVEEEGAAWAEPPRLVTSGPFALASASPDGAVSLTPNPRWYGERPALTEISIACLHTESGDAELAHAYAAFHAYLAGEARGEGLSRLE